MVVCWRRALDLDPITAALVLTSAALHPLWYALVKRDPDPDAAFVGLNAGFALLALGHAGLRRVDLIAGLGAWPLLLVSAAGQIAYGLAIVGVLKRGDLSAYYPIIRASPLAIVAPSASSRWASATGSCGWPASGWCSPAPSPSSTAGAPGSCLSP